MKKNMWIETFDPLTKEAVGEWCKRQGHEFTAWNNGRECTYIFNQMPAVVQLFTVFRLKRYLQKLLKESAIGVVGIKLFV